MPPIGPFIVETSPKAFEFAYLGLNGRLRRPVSSIQVRWYSPPANWFKLNFDSSSLGNSGRVGGRGIIQNSSGNWVSGYARAIGHTTNVAAELWALRDGINLCIALNLANVLVELDVKLVIDLLMKDEGKSNESHDPNLRSGWNVEGRVEIL
uniref:RNase H type-1 domain-containing protein n=1 Tax=Quercus lobata TaxID=97700 RepID=A0A7N2M4D3_QUELO